MRCVCGDGADVCSTMTALSLCLDTMHALEAKCAWLSTFGKAKQPTRSLLAYASEESSSQADVDRRVETLVSAELPLLERCHQRKVSAILREARRKVVAYKTALALHRDALLSANGMFRHARVCYRVGVAGC